MNVSTKQPSAASRPIKTDGSVEGPSHHYALSSHEFKNEDPLFRETMKVLFSNRGSLGIPKDDPTAIYLAKAQKENLSSTGQSRKCSQTESADANRYFI